MTRRVRLRVEKPRGDDRYTISLTAPDGGNTRAVSRFFGRTAWFENAISIIDFGDASTPEASAPAKELGRQLFNFLFAGPVGEYYYNWRAGDHKQSLEIALDISPEQCSHLLDVPWELIHDGSAFCILDGVRILRKVRSETRILNANARASVLVVSSNPRDLDTNLTLDSLAELGQFTAGDDRHADQILVLDIPSLSRLARIIRERPIDILHFIGHGLFERINGKATLLLETEDGEQDRVSADAFVRVLCLNRTLKLVVLNACDTAATSMVRGTDGLAWQLAASGIPAIIAMRTRISDSTAIEFSRAFYSALARTQSVMDAVDTARRHLAALKSSPPGAFVNPILIQSSHEPIEIAGLPIMIKERSVHNRSWHDALDRSRDLNALEHAIRTNSSRVTFLVGPTGVGKTSLVRELALVLRAKGTIDNYQEVKADTSVWHLREAPSSSSLVHIELSSVNTISAMEAFRRVEKRGNESFCVLEGTFTHPFPNEATVFAMRAISQGACFNAAITALGSGSMTKALWIALHCGGNVRLLAQLINEAANGDVSNDILMTRLTKAIYELRVHETLMRISEDAVILLCFLAVLGVPSRLEQMVAFGLQGRLGGIASLDAAFWELLGNGLLIMGPSATFEVEVPAWMKPATIALIKSEMLPSLHELAGTFILECEIETQMNRAAEHYYRAGLRDRAWVVRMGNLDDLEARSPVAALDECRDLLTDIPVAPSGKRLIAQTQVLIKMADCWRHLGVHAESRKYYSLAISTASEQPLDTSERDLAYLRTLTADALRNIARIEENEANYDDAKRHYERAAQIYRERNDLAPLARCQLALVMLEARHGPLDRLLALISTPLETAKALGDERLHADILTNIGIVELRRGSDKAQNTLESALEHGRKSGDQHVIASALFALGMLFAEKDDHADRSMRLLSEARALFEGNEERKWIIDSTVQIGLLYLKFGDMPDAAEEFCRAYQLSGEIGHDLTRIKSILLKMLPDLDELGGVFLKEGNLDLAGRFFDELEKIARLLDETRFSLMGSLARGVIAMERGDYNLAKDILLSCRTEALGLGDHVIAADAAHELGTIALIQNDLYGAQALYQNALEEKRRNAETVTATEHMIACLLAEQGQLQDARLLLEKTIEEERTNGNWEGYAESIGQLARVLLLMSRPDEAEREARRALKVCIKRLMAKGAILNLITLGEIYQGRGNVRRARKYLNKALEIARRTDDRRHTSVLMELLRDSSPLV